MVAVAQAHGIATLIDNTWATPLLLPALTMGIDIAIMACTKYSVGHSDVMMGSVTANARCWPRIQSRALALGQVVSADDAALALRGLRTLAVRLDRHGATALKVAQWLASRPEVAHVLHPALPDCPGHALWQRDFLGASGLFSFILNGGGDAERAAMIDALALFGIGYSWGGYESLAIPVDPQRHRSACPWSAPGPVVRIHAGLEDADDLIADLAHGLEVWQAARVGGGA